MIVKFTAGRGLLGGCALAIVLAATGCASSGGSAPAAPPSGRSPEAVIGKVWQWEATVTRGKAFEVPEPERYTLQLLPDGKLTAQMDCNRGTASYIIDEGTLGVSRVASTRAACPPGSLDGRFAREFNRANKFYVEDGKLYIELQLDGGTMRFRQAK